MPYVPLEFLQESFIGMYFFFLPFLLAPPSFLNSNMLFAKEKKKERKGFGHTDLKKHLRVQISRTSYFQ